MGSTGASSKASTLQEAPVAGGVGAVRGEGTHTFAPLSVTGDPAFSTCSGAGGSRDNLSHG